MIEFIQILEIVRRVSTDSLRESCRLHDLFSTVLYFTWERGRDPGVVARLSADLKNVKIVPATAVAERLEAQDIGRAVDVAHHVESAALDVAGDAPHVSLLHAPRPHVIVALGTDRVHHRHRPARRIDRVAVEHGLVRVLEEWRSCSRIDP